MALHEYGVWVKSADRGRRAVRGWTIFFILLIPLYIFAERPYGYTITRTRAESETLRGISKMAFVLGAMMYGSAKAIPWVEKIVTYSNGHTAREQDAGENAPVILMKIILYQWACGATTTGRLCWPRRDLLPHRQPGRTEAFST